MGRNLKRFVVLFIAGGTTYVALELLYRKKSHISMFVDGGICLYLIDLLCNRIKRVKKIGVFVRGLLGGTVITGIEFLTGLVVNKKLKLKVWDYSRLPLNVKGQICVGYGALWAALSLPVMALGRYLTKKTSL